MKVKIPYYLDFPDDFCKEAQEAVKKAYEKEVNLQFVGLEGSGKSLIFRSLLSRNSDYYLVDSNLLTEKAVEGLVDKLDEFRLKNARGVVLIDSFENVVNLAEEGTVKKVMSIYNQYRNYATFVFSVEKEVEMRSSYDVFYVRPMNRDDGMWFIKGLMRDEDKTKVGDALILKIVDYSGGIPGIIKRVFELVSKGEDLEDIVINPGKYARLTYQLELMVEGIGLESGTELMKKYHLVNDGGKFVSRILENYVGHLKGGIKKDYLTSEEHKVMSCLEKNRGRVVSRDEVIREIWGENSTRDISDHALDQLIHRLRSKLKKDGLEIETVRGRGYLLS